MLIQIRRLFFLVSIGCLNLSWLTPAYAAEIEVTDAYVHEMPPGVENAAVYLAIKNTSNRAVVLTHITSSRAAHVMIHQNTLQGDMMRMRPLSRLQIAPHSQFRFAPGGHHIMVMGLSQPLQTGQVLDLIFQFDEGLAIEVAVPVIGHGDDGSANHPMGMD